MHAVLRLSTKVPSRFKAAASHPPIFGKMLAINSLQENL